MELNKQLEKYLNQVEQYLTDTGSAILQRSELVVAESVRYSLLAGGKRIRPLLSFAVADSLGTEVDDQLIELASVIEMIHNYSLIHDDLPAMDNDELRRGKPTNHMVYGEGMALLAGDALLNLAYEKLFSICLKNPEFLEIADLIAVSAGINGMVGGQSMDLTGTEFSQEEGSLAYLIKLQKLKTGALIQAAVLTGYHYARIKHASQPEFCTELEDIYKEYAEILGLEFQLRDDLLDFLSSSEKLGKTTGKDLRDNKLTFVTLLGLEEAKQYDQKLIQRIDEILQNLQSRELNITLLKDLTNFLRNREY